jgi:hypothetical protein
MSLDKIDHIVDVSFYDFITCFKPIKNYDIMKAYCLSKNLQFLSDTSIKQLYVKRSKPLVLNLNPYIPTDPLNPISARALLILHHVHYSQLVEIALNCYSPNDLMPICLDKDAVNILKIKLSKKLICSSYDKSVNKEIQVQSALSSLTKESYIVSEQCTNTDDNTRDIEIEYDTIYSDDVLYDEHEDETNQAPNFRDDYNCSYISYVSYLMSHIIVVIIVKFIAANNYIHDIVEKYNKTKEEENSAFLCNSEIMNLDIMISKLSSEQLEAYYIACVHIHDDCKSDNSNGQLRLHIAGPGGTGKSEVLKSISLMAKINYGNVGGLYGSVLIMAPTGIAAFNIKGFTIHRALELFKFSKESENVSYLNRIQNNLGSVKLIIIDEISLLDQKMFRQIDVIFRKAKQNYEELFGGTHIVICGDFYQLPPVKGNSIYVKPTEINTNKQRGYEAFESFNHFVELTVNFRFFKDKDMEERAHRMRIGTVTENDILAFNVIPTIYDKEIINLPSDTLYVASTNVVKDAINEKANNTLLNDNVKMLHLWAKHRMGKSKKRKNDYIEDDNEHENNYFVHSNIFASSHSIDFKQKGHY